MGINLATQTFEFDITDVYMPYCDLDNEHPSPNIAIIGDFKAGDHNAFGFLCRKLNYSPWQRSFEQRFVYFCKQLPLQHQITDRSRFNNAHKSIRQSEVDHNLIMSHHWLDVKLDIGNIFVILLPMLKKMTAYMDLSVAVYWTLSRNLTRINGKTLGQWAWYWLLMNKLRFWAVLKEFIFKLSFKREMCKSKHSMWIS